MKQKENTTQLAGLTTKEGIFAFYLKIPFGAITFDVQVVNGIVDDVKDIQNFEEKLKMIESILKKEFVERTFAIAHNVMFSLINCFENGTTTSANYTISEELSDSISQSIIEDYLKDPVLHTQENEIVVQMFIKRYVEFLMLRLTQNAFNKLAKLTPENVPSNTENKEFIQSIESRVLTTLQQLKHIDPKADTTLLTKVKSIDELAMSYIVAFIPESDNIFKDKRNYVTSHLQIRLTIPKFTTTTETFKALCLLAIESAQLGILLCDYENFYGLFEKFLLENNITEAEMEDVGSINLLYFLMDATKNLNSHFINDAARLEKENPGFYQQFNEEAMHKAKEKTVEVITAPKKAGKKKKK